MNQLYRDYSQPGLLVSVRNADEARIALEGGADVIDVKEPSRGSLGAADAEVVAAVVRAIGGSVPISVAAGELIDHRQSGATSSVSAFGVAYIKLGLAGCAVVSDWPEWWREV